MVRPSVAKITAPHVPGLLLRQRLIDRLEESQDKKVVFILGPAAQGKSALAMSYVMASPKPAAWMNLGPEDSDPVNFYYLLVHALQQTFPDLKLAPLLEYAGVSIGPREELLLYRDWILRLVNAIVAPVTSFWMAWTVFTLRLPPCSFSRFSLSICPPIYSS